MLDERAVSDSLGFVLVFGIIISTVAVVYVGGFNAIDNARQFERMNNAERAFEVFADNVEDMTQRDAPTRATEIKLAEATLKDGDEETLRINVTRASDHQKFGNRTIGYEPIVYQSETEQSNQMVYALGGTLRSSAGGTTVSTEPPWILNESRVMIPIIDTVPEGGSQVVSGSETVLVRTSISRQQVVFQNTTEKSDVWINITSSRDDAWRNYLSGEDAVECASDISGLTEKSDTVRCRVTEVETVYVTFIQINYKFE